MSDLNRHHRSRRAYTMAGVGLNTISSPKPLSYLQQTNQSYNPYQVHRGLSAAGYNDAPLNVAQPIPQQHTQFMGSGMGNGNGMGGGVDEDGKIYSLVIDLMDPGSREGALLELSKKREQYEDLALVLWHSFGVLCFSSCLLTPLTIIAIRYHAGSVARDCFCVPPLVPSQPYCPRF